MLGDIRVRFNVVDPEEISVIGKFTSEPMARVSVINDLKSSDLEVGMAHAGAHSFEVSELGLIFCSSSEI